MLVMWNIAKRAFEKKSISVPISNQIPMGMSHLCNKKTRKGVKTLHDEMQVLRSENARLTRELDVCRQQMCMGVDVQAAAAAAGAHVQPPAPVAAADDEEFVFIDEQI